MLLAGNIASSTQSKSCINASSYGLVSSATGHDLPTGQETKLATTAGTTVSTSASPATVIFGSIDRSSVAASGTTGNPFGKTSRAQTEPSSPSTLGQELSIVAAPSSSLVSTASGPSKQVNILAMDLDGTLIRSPLGSVSPYNWRWNIPLDRLKATLANYVRAGWHLVIFSNQQNLLASPSRLAQFQQRLTAVLIALELPVAVLVAGGGKYDKYRKPSRTMFDYYLHWLQRQTGAIIYAGYYVGDAEGPSSPIEAYRWSDSDAKFAMNTGLVFRRPEAVFGELAKQ